MSGGEQQRAAIATALVNEPKVLLADEPTGELDTATAAEVFGALQRANTELGVTVLIVTHDPAVSAVVRRPSRSGTAGPAPRSTGARPPATTARWRTMRWSTPCWTGPAACSCRAR